MRYSSYKGVLDQFWSVQNQREREGGKNRLGPRGLIVSHRVSRRGSVVQYAEGGINSSLIVTEMMDSGRYISPTRLFPLLFPALIPWIEIYLKRRTAMYPGGLRRGVSRPSCELRKRDTGCTECTACALESSARKIKPSSITSRLDDHTLFIVQDESWERARLQAETSPSFSHVVALPHAFDSPFMRNDTFTWKLTASVHNRVVCKMIQ